MLGNFLPRLFPTNELKEQIRPPERNHPVGQNRNLKLVWRHSGAVR
jgi:hypothetical protein